MSNNLLLRILIMLDKNFYILRDPSAGLPHRPYDVRYWMDVHARDLQNMSNLYHDDCSRVTYVEWELDTDQRLNYVVEEPCLAFDAYWRPFTATLLKLWLGLTCQENHYFICITPMDGTFKNDCMIQKWLFTDQITSFVKSPYLYNKPHSLEYFKFATV